MDLLWIQIRAWVLVSVFELYDSSRACTSQLKAALHLHITSSTWCLPHFPHFNCTFHGRGSSFPSHVLILRPLYSPCNMVLLTRQPSSAFSVHSSRASSCRRSKSSKVQTQPVLSGRKVHLCPARRLGPSIAPMLAHVQPVTPHSRLPTRRPLPRVAPPPSFLLASHSRKQQGPMDPTPESLHHLP